MKFEFNNTEPLYIQVMDDIKLQIMSGKLKTKDQVQSVRDLAIYYGLNPNTVQKALVELEREGLMKSERTTGRFITVDNQAIEEMKKTYARQKTGLYLDEMGKLGYSHKDSIEIINEIEGESNDKERD